MTEATRQAPSTTTPVLDQRLAAVARRLRIARGLEQGARVALALAPLGLVVALVRWLVPGSPFLALPALDVGLAVLGSVLVLFLSACLAVTLRTSPGRAVSAQQIETLLGLGAPLTTALEVGASHPWAALVALEAERAATSVVPAHVVPLPFPRSLARALALVALAAAVLALPPREASAPAPADAPVALAPAALDALARAGTRLRLATASLPSGPARRRLEEAGARLQDLVAQVEAGKVGQREALDRLGAAADAVRLERDAVTGRRAARRALEHGGSLDPLAAAASGHGAPDERAVRSLATALTRDAHARETAQTALRQAREALGQDPATAAALERAEHALDAARPGESPPPDLAPALDAAARALAATQGPERDEQASGELARVASELDHARESLTSTPKEPASLAAGEKPVASPAPQKVALADKKPADADKATASGDKTPSPSDKTPSPSDKTPSPSDKTPSPSDKTPSPSDKTSSPSDKTSSPSDKTPSPSDKTPSPSDKTPSPSDKTPSPSPSDAPQEPGETKLPLEAAAELAKMIPADLLAQMLKLGAKLKDVVPTPDLGAPPKVSPEQAEKLLDRLPPETLKKLAKAMSEVAKDLPPPPANGKGQAPPIDPATAERLAKKLPPEVLESLAKAAREAPAQPGREGQPGPQSGTEAQASREGAGAGTGAKTVDPGARRLGTGTPGEGTAEELGPDPLATKTGSGPKGPGGFEGRDTSGKAAAGSSPSAPAGANASGTGDPAATGAQPGAVAKTGAPTGPNSGTGTTRGNPMPRADVSGEGSVVDDATSGAASGKPLVSWGTAPEKLPAVERAALRSALESKRVPPSYERAVREYFDLTNQ